jgi:hypothetical protein
LEELVGWTWDTHQEAWDRNYQDLMDYLLLNSFEYPLFTHKIGRWVNTQRSAYKKESLSPEKVALLEKLEKWTWNELDHAWHSRYNELIRLSKNIGVGVKLSTRDELGRWTTKQRYAHKQKRLPPERVELLEKIDGWGWIPHDDIWKSRYLELKRFIMTNQGQIYDKKNLALTNWVGKQKYLYGKGEIGKERIALLELLDGWQW